MGTVADVRSETSRFRAATQARRGYELRAPEPVWVYVLDEDAAGEREPTAARHAGPGPVTRLAEQLASGHDPNLWLRRFTARHGPPESARP